MNPADILDGLIAAAGRAGAPREILRAAVAWRRSMGVLLLVNIEGDANGLSRYLLGEPSDPQIFVVPPKDAFGVRALYRLVEGGSIRAEDFVSVKGSPVEALRKRLLDAQDEIGRQCEALADAMKGCIKSSPTAGTFTFNRNPYKPRIHTSLGGFSAEIGAPLVASAPSVGTTAQEKTNVTSF